MPNSDKPLSDDVRLASARVQAYVREYAEAAGLADELRALGRRVTQAQAERRWQDTRAVLAKGPRWLVKL